MKLFYRASQKIVRKWKNPPLPWRSAVTQFAI
jgi:hypothetical protein